MGVRLKTIQRLISIDRGNEDRFGIEVLQWKQDRVHGERARKILKRVPRQPLSGSDDETRSVCMHQVSWAPDPCISVRFHTSVKAADRTVRRHVTTSNLRDWCCKAIRGLLSMCSCYKYCGMICYLSFRSGLPTAFPEEPIHLLCVNKRTLTGVTELAASQSRR